MKRIAIIGSPGSGKSTFARKLGSIFNINVVYLDRVFWQPGWKEKPRDTRIEILLNLVQEKQWIIEGTYLSSSEPRLEAADTIIFLDFPSFLCLQRIIKRHYNYQGHSRRDLREGCKDKPNLIRILKVLVFPFRGRRTLKQKLRKYESNKIVWLHSPKDVEDFLAPLEPHREEKKQFSNSPSAARKRQLAASR